MKLIRLAAAEASSRFGVVILAAAVLVGCSSIDTASQDASPPPGLTDSDWILAALPGTPLLPAPQATLRFEGDRASGGDGCNRYSIGFTAANGKLAFGPQRTSTQMACPEPASQLARAFNAVLDNARGYRIEAGSLLLLSASGATLATLAPQPQTLAGTAWQVDAYNNGREAVVNVITGTQLTLEFGASGELRGSGGCNNFNGRYTAKEGTLSIGQVASTRMACMQPDGRMAQEAAFLAALQSVTQARREADRLELRTASGALAVSGRLAALPKP
ncbi:MAG: META domain-containing protein [Burkholderiaceae bacterium]|jgi:heat shock protein HslJ|nr:META domain-containing protein [Burkholderiaceae bacterium]MCU0965576.1 META domain-containing protein [Burkholderiaceae bacterium]